jgi:hypothetical protein
MEYIRKNIELKTEKNAYDNDDMAMECNAYLKTKLFMAKRIAEQQSEIETLKEQLYYHTVRHTQMYDSLRQINEQLNFWSKCKFQVDEVNLSGELASSVVIEEEKEIFKNDFNENDKDKIINCLKNENLELRKELEILKTENLERNMFINKLTNDKFILFTELSELVSSLRRVDLNKLNQFYMMNTEKDALMINSISVEKNSSFKMISSMGVKYNILSAKSQLTLLINNSIKNETDKKLYESLNFNENKVNNNVIIHNNFDNQNYFNVEKLIGVIKSYEDELNSFALDHKFYNKPFKY